jgi:hypothetical protein
LLIRIARVLQQLVNMVNRGDVGVLEGAADTPEQMVFVKSNLPRIRQFLENVGTKTMEGLDTPR